MNTEKTRSLNIAFVLDSRALHRVTDLLTTRVLERIELDERRTKKELEYNVELSDGTSKAMSSIEDLLNLSNSPTRQIKTLRISTPFKVNEARATVWFKNQILTPVFYSLRGEEEAVESLSSNLEDEISGMRQWYTPLTLDRLLTMTLGILNVLAFLFLASVVLLILWENPLEALKGLVDNVPTTVATILLVLPPVILCLLAVFGTKLFPVGIFAIGQGEQRHKRLQTIRKLILTGVLLPIPVGIVINLIS